MFSSNLHLSKEMTSSSKCGITQKKEGEVYSSSVTAGLSKQNVSYSKED